MTLVGLLRALLLGAVGLGILACSGAGARPGESGGTVDDGTTDGLRVVATTTVLADLVRQVGGADVVVTSLVPNGGEVHTFDPTPSDVQRIVEADLVVMNGLGLDEWLGDLVADAGTDARVVELAEGLDGVEYLEAAGHGAEDGTHAGEDLNPHLWLNVGYARRYAERIGATLGELDPEHAPGYDTATTRFDERLATLDDDVRTAIASVPQDRRRVVVFHEAFPYFAAAYGLEIVGTVVDAPGQDPSAGQIADLVAAIREARVAAIFSEVQFNDDLVRTLADETGVAVVSDLYTDTLGDPPVDTYEGMIRWDLDRIVAALRG